ncbi:hypothetical protein GALMADRAFT_783715 [Galerina marginata CBS 339.88]|uniref:Uncharacterized protein n=1 Tax=Galerina marginata (strain CBS 339.88) TaxID=685588 RepID=A0A067SYN1_GALM3|nr:hypothetical protein GALMADRAFT_783715 [Galerina marginata CBS 339.88]
MCIVIFAFKCPGAIDASVEVNNGHLTNELPFLQTLFVHFYLSGLPHLTIDFPFLRDFLQPSPLPSTISPLKPQMTSVDPAVVSPLQSMCPQPLEPTDLSEEEQWQKYFNLDDATSEHLQE